MAEIRVLAGTAGFALGLSIAGLYAAGTASADAAQRDTSTAQRASSPAGPARGATAPNRGPQRHRAASPAKPAATQRAAGRTARAATRDRTSVQAVVPVPAVPEPTAPATPSVPSITVHNGSTAQPLWVYNLTTTGDYSIPDTPWPTAPPPPTPPADWTGPVKIEAGSSAPVTLAAFNAPAGSPGNRIYFVQGSEFTLPVVPTSGIDPFYPGGSPGNDSFQNYSFVEYSLYPAGGGHEYTIDVSYIDEWSLPIQTKFTIGSAAWTGAVDGKTYGFNDFDTVVSQLNAAGDPYGRLVWSGATPWDPQPPSTVSRIVGPDKVWTAQSGEPPSNFTMSTTGWVPASYQDFVQYGSYQDTSQQTVYPYAFNGTQLTSPPVPPAAPNANAQNNFDFWRYEVGAPGSTPYPIALRSAAIHDGFPADAAGVYGFFTYPNDEAAGQFTNIPTAVSLDIYVYGSSDGSSDAVTPGGVWRYTSSLAPGEGRRRTTVGQPMLSGTAATDTFILNAAFRNRRVAPRVDVSGPGGDIALIDKTTLGATSTTVDVVDRAWFLCRGLSGEASQFVYERATGNLYYDRNPNLPGYTAVLAKLGDLTDPAGTVFVL